MVLRTQKVSCKLKKIVGVDGFFVLIVGMTTLAYIKDPELTLELISSQEDQLVQSKSIEVS